MDNSYGWLLRFFCMNCDNSWLRVKRAIHSGQEEDKCAGCNKSIRVYSVSIDLSQNGLNFPTELEPKNG